MACIKEVSKIYSDGRHNAFTDMEYWKGHYYVLFRNANGHASAGPAEVQGRMLVIRSADLREWELCGSISTGGDDRDGALVDMGDELGVFFGSSFPIAPDKPLYTGKRERKIQSHASFTYNGTTWSSPEPIYEPEQWLWQVEKFGDVYYGTVENVNWEFRLVRSVDGRNWETVSKIPPGKVKCTEDGLWITEDEVMHIVVRAWEREGMAPLLRSRPPYKDWEMIRLNYTVHCPVIRPVGDELWVAGKTITAQFPSGVEIPPEPSPERIVAMTCQDARLAKTPQDWHTAIWRLAGDHLEPIVVLPSRGDCGYPGLVVEDDRVLVCYFSQHDVDQGPKPKTGEYAAEIFLAEIAL